MRYMYPMAAMILALVMFAGCYAYQPMNYGQHRAGVTRGGYVDGPLTTAVNASETQSQGKIAEFSTQFKNPKRARAHNITLAGQKIDESVVQPGEEFSFNTAVGPTTKRNGFMLGMVFNSGRRSQGYGGGVCQVSSTLFNTAKQAGMEITERHEHSLDVGYIERGKDAATSYGVKDLKFVNPHEYPVRINAYVVNETIVVEMHRL